MSQELVLTLHGLGVPHSSVPREEVFFWVSRRAFSTLLEVIVAVRNAANIPTIITFDDGHVSDATIALPELISHGLRAVFFICAGRIGTPQYLDRAALEDILAAGMEIGTHGTEHRDWRKLDDNSLDYELAGSRRRIEDVCARSVTKAAIPFGSYDRRVLKRLRQEKFETVYTSDGGLAKSEAWLKPRCTIDSTWQKADMQQVLSAKPSISARLRRNAALLYNSLR
jgi:peptidoglycan/xylan/chitin deacetylase (PgdA/CDA1 family)